MTDLSQPQASGPAGAALQKARYCLLGLYTEERTLEVLAFYADKPVWFLTEVHGGYLADPVVKAQFAAWQTELMLAIAARKPTQPKAPYSITLPDYWHRLHFAEWLYDYSDDPGMWRQGRDEIRELEALALNSPEHRALFDAFRAWAHSGPGFDCERLPVPALSTETRAAA